MQQLYFIMIFFNLSILDSLYKESTDSWGPLKFNISNALFCVLFIASAILLWFCPHIWHSYLRWVSKRAWCIILSKENVTKYLIFGRRQFALFSFSLKFSRWFLNARCLSSISLRYFVLQMIFVFCWLILKFMFLVINRNQW